MEEHIRRLQASSSRLPGLQAQARLRPLQAPGARNMPQWVSSTFVHPSLVPPPPPESNSNNSQQQQPNNNNIVENDYEEIGPVRRQLNNNNEQQHRPLHPATMQAIRHPGRPGAGSEVHCDLCGSAASAVRCDKCAGQVFCLSCDDMYHRHPKRSAHVRKAVDVSSRPFRPPLPPKADLHTPPVPPPRRNKRPFGLFTGKKEQSPALPRKENGSGVMGSLKRFMGVRPLPPPPSHKAGGLSSVWEESAPLPPAMMRAHAQRSLSQPAADANAALPASVANINSTDGRQGRPAAAARQEMPQDANDAIRPRSQSVSGHMSPQSWLYPSQDQHNHPLQGFVTTRRGQTYHRMGGGGGGGGWPHSPTPGMAGAAGTGSVCDLPSVAPLHHSHTHAHPGFVQHMMHAQSMAQLGCPTCHHPVPGVWYPGEPPPAGLVSYPSNTSLTGGAPYPGGFVSSARDVRQPSPAPSGRSMVAPRAAAARARRLARSQMELSSRYASDSDDDYISGVESDDESERPEVDVGAVVARSATPTAAWSCQHCTFQNGAGTRVCAMCCRTHAPTAQQQQQQRRRRRRRFMRGSMPPGSPAPSSLGRGSSPGGASSGVPRSREPSQPREPSVTDAGSQQRRVGTAVDVAEKLAAMKMAAPAAASEARTPDPARRDASNAADISNPTTTDNSSAKSLSNVVNTEMQTKPRDGTKKTTSQGTSPPPQTIATQTSEELELYHSQTSIPRVGSRASLAGEYEQFRYPLHRPRPILKRTQSFQAFSQQEREERADPWFSPFAQFSSRYQHRSRSGSKTSVHSDSRAFGAYGSGASSRDESPARYGVASGPAERQRALSYAGDTARKPADGSDYLVGLEELMMKKKQQDAAGDHGMELVLMLRDAEKHDFSPEDLQIALNHCGERAPVAWLLDNLESMLETVCTLATNYGHERTENDVGTISNKEARDALRLHKGNVWTAVTECVEQRRKKYGQLASRGAFAREDIITALTANHGNVEAAYLDLNRTQLRPFLMRIWGPPQGVPVTEGAPPAPEQAAALNNIGPEKTAMTASKPVEGGNSADQITTENGAKSAALEGNTSQTVSAQPGIADWRRDRRPPPPPPAAGPASDCESDDDEAAKSKDFITPPSSPLPSRHIAEQNLVETTTFREKVAGVACEKDSAVSRSKSSNVSMSSSFREIDPKQLHTEKPQEKVASTPAQTSISTVSTVSAIQSTPSNKPESENISGTHPSKMTVAPAVAKEVKPAPTEEKDEAPIYSSVRIRRSVTPQPMATEPVAAAAPADLTPPTAPETHQRGSAMSEVAVGSPESAASPAARDSAPQREGSEFVAGLTERSSSTSSVSPSKSSSSSSVKTEKSASSASLNKTRSASSSSPLSSSSSSRDSLVMAPLAKKSAVLNVKTPSVDSFLAVHTNRNQDHSKNAKDRSPVEKESVTAETNEQLVISSPATSKSKSPSPSSATIQETTSQLTTAAKELGAIAKQASETASRLRKASLPKDERDQPQNDGGDFLYASPKDATTTYAVPSSLPVLSTPAKTSSVAASVNPPLASEESDSNEYELALPIQHLTSNVGNRTTELARTSPEGAAADGENQAAKTSVDLTAQKTDAGESAENLERERARKVISSHVLQQQGCLQGTDVLPPGTKVEDAAGEVSKDEEDIIYADSVVQGEASGESSSNGSQSRDTGAVSHSENFPKRRSSNGSTGSENNLRGVNVVSTSSESISEGYEGIMSVKFQPGSGVQPQGPVKLMQMSAASSTESLTHSYEPVTVVAANPIANQNVTRPKTARPTASKTDTSYPDVTSPQISVSSEEEVHREVQDDELSTTRTVEGKYADVPSCLATNSSMPVLSSNPASDTEDLGAASPQRAIGNEISLAPRAESPTKSSTTLSRPSSAAESFASARDSAHPSEPEPAGSSADQSRASSAADVTQAGDVIGRSSAGSSEAEEESSSSEELVSVTEARPSEQAVAQLREQLKSGTADGTRRASVDAPKVKRRASRLLRAGRARSQVEAELASQLIGLQFPAEESLQAAEECSSLYTALSFLNQECELCAGRCSVKQMVSMTHCTHRCCRDCAATYFTQRITERPLADLRCPFCNEPDLTVEDVASDYFSHLDIMLKSLVSAEVHGLFHKKLFERAMMKDPNFKWCPKCSSGFIAQPRQKRVTCPDCGTVSCGLCAKVWAEQHEGVACEIFADWQRANDPDYQSLGLEKHLALSGISCPACKFRYALAKGGCMHFTCTQCKYEFCSGCSRPFRLGSKCGVTDYCARLGLHAHHPRHCLFYLRDRPPTELQRLLTENGIAFDTEPPALPPGGAGVGAELNRRRCRVQEQKETVHGLKDDLCGRAVFADNAGLCRMHYVEYLSGLIWKHKIDPVSICDASDLRQEMRRHGKRARVQRVRESDDKYAAALRKIVQEEIPLDP